MDFFNYDTISSLFMYLGVAVLLVLFGKIVFSIYLIKGLIEKVG